MYSLVVSRTRVLAMSFLDSRHRSNTLHLVFLLWGNLQTDTTFWAELSDD